MGNDPKEEKRKRPYDKPTVNNLTREEAKQKLLDAFRRGDEGAKQILEMLFPEEAKRLRNTDKKSA